MNNEIGISIGGLQIIYGDEEAIRIASEIRADAVDFDLSDSRFDSADELSVYSRSDDEVFEYFNELRKTAENLGLKISQTHGRLRTFYNDEKKDIVTIENARKKITRIILSVVLIRGIAIRLCAFITTRPRRILFEEWVIM